MNYKLDVVMMTLLLFRTHLMIFLCPFLRLSHPYRLPGLFTGMGAYKSHLFLPPLQSFAVVWSF
jgi:hypothetical protein